jgi:transposase-like protein
VALLLDGLQLGGQFLVMTLGVAADRTKHALRLWDGSTENATVHESLLTNLQSRGLRTDGSLLVTLRA